MKIRNIIAGWAGSNPTPEQVEALADAIAQIHPAPPIRSLCGKVIAKGNRRVKDIEKKRAVFERNKEGYRKRREESRLHKMGITKQVREVSALTKEKEEK